MCTHITRAISYQCDAQCLSSAIRVSIFEKHRIVVETFDRIFSGFGLEMESHISAFSAIVDACLLICKHSVMFEITLHRRYHVASIWAQSYVNVHSINVSTTFEFIHLFSFQLHANVSCWSLVECIEITYGSIWNPIWHAILGNCAKYTAIGLHINGEREKSNSLIKRLCVCVCCVMRYTLISGDNFSPSSSSFVFYIKHSMIETIEIAHVPHMCVCMRACVFKQLNFWTMLNLKIIYRIKNNYVIINWFKDIHECRRFFVFKSANVRIPIMCLCERNRVWYTWKLFLMKWCTYLLWCIIAITAHLCKYGIRDVAALFNRHTRTHEK